MLSVLLVFSFLNVTMFTDYANAEGDNGEATEFAEPVGEPEAQAQPEDEANGPESEEPRPLPWRRSPRRAIRPSA